MKFSIFPHLVFSYCPGAGLRHSNSLMLRLMAGIERHRSIHRLDSTVVCTACWDGRKEKTRWRSSSSRALNRSGASPPPARARLGAASISTAAKRRRRGRDRTSQASTASLLPPPPVAAGWRSQRCCYRLVDG